MLPLSNSEALNSQVIDIPLSLRWQVYHRLQELMISCWCCADGSLRVQINNLLTAVLVRSTLMQLLASRQELIDWLEQCWQL